MQISGDIATIRDLFDDSPEAKVRRDKEAAEMRALYDARIEWHKDSCVGRHGVVRNVSKDEEQTILRMLTYFFGDGCAWGGDKGELEFVHMTKVYPPPTRPWEWCGEAALSKTRDWHTATRTQQERSDAAKATLKPWDIVTFKATRGRTIRGVVTRIMNKVQVLDAEGGTWMVSAASLTRVGRTHPF